MHYEVEQKYRAVDTTAIEQWLTARGATIEPPVVQMDQYFAHPARDFAQTDEALRIRSVGERNWVTYKGPKIDAATKTRRELELPIEPGTDGAARFTELITALGFSRVAAVRKQRRTAHLAWQTHEVEIALDDVDGVGQYCELEISANASELDAARKALAALAAELGLSHSERRSYLELLLQR